LERGWVRMPRSVGIRPRLEARLGADAAFGRHTSPVVASLRGLRPKLAGFEETDVTRPGWGTDRTAGQARTRPWVRHRALRRALLTVALLLVVAGAAVAWVGVDALRSRGELRAAAAQVHVLQGQVAAGDSRAAAATLRSLQGHAAAARSGTHGLHWSAARILPWLGPNVRAVQTVSEVIDDVARGPLPALTGAAAVVNPRTLAPVNGRVNLAPLVQAAPRVGAADAQVQGAVRRLDAVDRQGLLPAVAVPLSDLRIQLRRVALTTATAARAVRLLPPMLGADGPRTYLLLVQNNSEQRATGGVPTLILLRAVQGAVTVAATHSTGGNLANLDKPILPLTAEEQALYGNLPGTYMSDVTMTQVSWRGRSGSPRSAANSTEYSRSIPARSPGCWARRVRSGWRQARR